MPLKSNVTEKEILGPFSGLMVLKALSSMTKQQVGQQAGSQVMRCAVLAGQREQKGVQFVDAPQWS